MTHSNNFGNGQQESPVVEELILTDKVFHVRTAALLRSIERYLRFEHIGAPMLEFVTSFVHASSVTSIVNAVS